MDQSETGGGYRIRPSPTEWKIYWHIRRCLPQAFVWQGAKSERKTGEGYRLDGMRWKERGNRRRLGHDRNANYGGSRNAKRNEYESLYWITDTREITPGVCDHNTLRLAALPTALNFPLDVCDTRLSGCYDQRSGLQITKINLQIRRKSFSLKCIFLIKTKLLSKNSFFYYWNNYFLDWKTLFEMKWFAMKRMLIYFLVFLNENDCSNHDLPQMKPDATMPPILLFFLFHLHATSRIRFLYEILYSRAAYTWHTFKR